MSRLQGTKSGGRRKRKDPEDTISTLEMRKLLGKFLGEREANLHWEKDGLPAKKSAQSKKNE